MDKEFRYSLLVEVTDFTLEDIQLVEKVLLKKMEILFFVG